MKEIYLDNNATTRVTPEVLEAMMPYFEQCFGNASSPHRKGMEADRALYESRKKILEIFGVAETHEVIFTSGGTESDNLAIIGTARAADKKRHHIVTTSVEHSAVLESVRTLDSGSASTSSAHNLGFEITYVSPREDGVVHMEDILKVLRENTVLVSVMQVNNETGAIFPVEEIAKAVKAKNPECTVHVDGVQAVGKLRPDFTHIDLYSISGHKFHAPKGIGALLVPKKLQAKSYKLKAILHGGGQEFGLRSGTENVPGAVALAKALELSYENFDANIKHCKQLKKALITGIVPLGDVVINSPENSVDQTLNVSFLGIPGEVLLNALSERGIYVSTGSACSNRRQRKSHVLAALGLPEERINSSIRFSFSRYNTTKEMEGVVRALDEIVPKLRSVASI